MKQKSSVYLDHAATTPVAAEALEAMLPYCRELYGNPSGSYQLAKNAAEAVEEARQVIASIIGAQQEEIYFTSGGTESDNWAIKMGTKGEGASGRKHMITSQIEHHAVLRSCKAVEAEGGSVTYAPVDRRGIVSVSHIEQTIRPDTGLISVMYANNEVGTLQPIGQIGNLAKKHHICFHTDAVQAFGHVPIDVKKQQISMLSASSHKCYGPKGVGFLYISSDLDLSPFIHGGGQEKHKRAGTENVPGIVGFAKAAALCAEHMEERMQQEMQLRDYLIGRIRQEIPYVQLNGCPRRRLPGNVSVCLEFVESAALQVLLDYDGICVSGGSACSTNEVGPSHVLTAMGVPETTARGALRMTLGVHTTKGEIDYTVERLKMHVRELRQTSPDFL